MYSKQRLTLFGHLKTIDGDDKQKTKELQKCYLSYHPDAKHFIPGSPDSPHLAIWTTFIVDRVYRVGGYGDESQIGWLDMNRWHRAGSRDHVQRWRNVQQQASLFFSEDKEGDVTHSASIQHLFADQDDVVPQSLLFQ